MIARLRGTVDALGPDWLVIDVGGVGYLVRCATRTREALPGPGEAVSLLIETQVREESITLYGFAEAAERDWFTLLQTVQGVGARVALALLGALGPDGLGAALQAGDARLLARANGVGTRLAARIVTELKGKAPLGAIATTAAALAGAPAATSSSGTEADAISALINLGYRPPDAQRAISAARQRLGEGVEIAALIRGGLRELSP